ncbi:MAG: DNRLRE domain-containing protein [Planctomycetota bacterium]|jgi:hypothetical protein
MKKILFFTIMALVLTVVGGGVGAYAAPVISFVEPPTPVDGASIEDTSVEIEVSITEFDLKDVIFNWDGTDYSLYDDSLVLMFNFDNVALLGEDYVNGSEVIDVSGSGNNGILSVTPGIPQWIAGRYGGAFDFTGNGVDSGQSILVPHDDSLNPGSGDFALAVWILTRNDVDGDILRKGSSTTAGTWYKIEHSPGLNNNKIGLNFNTDGTDALFASVAAYNDYQWHFVVAQRKGNSAELWIDGVLEGTASVTGSISNTANLAVGSKDTQDDDFINSSLDEVRIYMRSFSQGEIKELYYSNLNKYDTDKWTLYVNQPNLSDETTYTYQASASDGQVTSNTVVRSLTVDLIGPPVVTLEAPSDGSILNNTDVTFTCSATDDIGLLDASLYVGSPPETVTFSGSADTDDAQLYATDDSSTPEVEGPDTNAGTVATINVDGANPHAHAVIKFLNVFGGGAGQVPLGSTIVSATLGVNCTNPGNMMKMYRLTENWAEGEVTWNNAGAGEPWVDGGADGPGSNAGFAIDGDCTATGWRTLDITQFAQEWSDGAANFGIVLTDSGATDGIDFDSSESANPPVLTVIFGQSGLQLIETVAMSGTSDSVSFSTVNLVDQQDYTWNCLVRNTTLMESWAPADFQLTVDTAYPDEPILVQPADDSTVVGLSPTLEVTVGDPQGDLLDVTFYSVRAGSTDEFTIVVLPDAQNYSEFPENAHIFTEQTQWIVDNIAARNIVFVTQEGDIVEHPDNTTEYDRARDSMSVLDPGLADLSNPTLPDPLVAYGVGPGNHDQPTGPPPSGYYNEYFPYTHYENRGLSWYGGHWPATGNDNNYQLFTAGGMDFIIMHLEYNPGSTIDDPVIGWADGVLKAHPDRMAIITTHAYIDTSANLISEGTGIWNVLVQDNDNVYFVLCGHKHGEARRTDVVNGREVHQILSDYQSRTNGGNGWLRIMRFVPKEDKVYIETYSPHLDQYETDADSQFTLNLPMDSFTVIGTDTGVASGSNASVVWAGLLDGTEYNWFVEATDTAQNTQGGPTWSFTAIDDPQQATNPSPVHGTVDVDIDTNLTWTIGVDAVSHNVYFGIDPDPRTQTPVNRTTNSYDPGPLNPSTTYYWAVDELDGGGGLLSAGAIWSFTTASTPGQASAPIPGDTAQDIPIDADLNWTAGSDTTSHDVYFGTSSPGTFQGNQPGTTFIPVSMDYATTYYWRIDEVGPGGTTTGATVWSFTTLPSPPPGQATNPNPADAAAGVPVDADLSWTAGSNATLHDVYFGTDPGALPLVSPQQPVMFTSYDPGTMEEGVTYYWQIDEYNIDNVKTEGVLWSFTTVLPDPPEMAIPTAPIDGQGSAVNVLDIGVGVILTWFSGDRAASHDVYFGTSYDQVLNADNASPEFKGNILQSAGTYIPETGDTYFTWDPTPLADEDLPYESSYWWRIDEINPGGVTEGAIWNFTTESDTYPPVFAYPPDAVSITAQEATIIWTTNELSDSNVGYSLDTSYGSKVYDGTLVKVHSVTLTGLQPGTTYYYRATSTDQAGNSTTEYPDPNHLFFTTETLPPELPWNDDFESGDFAVGGWTVVATPASVDGGAAYTGSFGAHLKKGGTIEKSISTAGYQAIHVKYARTTSNLKSTEFLFVDWYDGSGWHELETTQDTSWASVDLICGGAGADNNPDFKIRFRINARKASTEALVDDVEITGTPSGPDLDPPTPDPMTWASAPQATGSTSISMTATTASDISGVEYYFACITDPAHDSGWQDSSTYDDTGLATGIEYTYQVKARDKSPSPNETGFSNPASATPIDIPPSAPTGLVATAGNGQVSLDWNDNTEPDLDGYNVYRSEASGGPYTLIATLPATSDYLDSTVVNGTTYYYVVTAVDQALNESGSSNEASATPDSVQAVSVLSIDMTVFPGKKDYATATIAITPGLDGATVVGDWYFKGVVRTTSATAVTNGSGIAEFTSLETPGKSGDTFMFVVTDIIASGYIYDESSNVETSDSIAIP